MAANRQSERSSPDPELLKPDISGRGRSCALTGEGLVWLSEHLSCTASGRLQQAHRGSAAVTCEQSLVPPSPSVKHNLLNTPPPQRGPFRLPPPACTGCSTIFIMTSETGGTGEGRGGVRGVDMMSSNSTWREGAGGGHRGSSHEGPRRAVGHSRTTQTLLRSEPRATAADPADVAFAAKSHRFLAT